MTREVVVGRPRRLARRRVPLAITAAAVLVLVVVFGGWAVMSYAASRPAPHTNVLLGPPQPLTADGTASPGGSSPSAAPARHATAVPSPPMSATPRATPSPAATSPRQTVVVRYLVVRQWATGFKGEVTVVNNGSAPIAGWRITIALPNDQITSFRGASGSVSDHTLLLQPASSADPLAAGGELRVSFVADGPEITPTLCAFNTIACGATNG